MISRWLALLFGFAALTAAPRAALAQTAHTAVIRGTVSTAAGEPLVSAVVAIADLDLRQFSNAQGKFYFVNVPAGKHHLTVRQLGYAQQAREVTVAAGETMDIDFQLERIATKLVPMQVSGKWKCDIPGRTVSANNAPLAQVFEQLEQNAVRLSLLAEQYPYDAVVSRLRLLKHADGVPTVDLHDSVRTPSSSTPRYSPGKVVIRCSEAGGAVSACRKCQRCSTLPVPCSRRITAFCCKEFSAPMV